MIRPPNIISTTPGAASVTLALSPDKFVLNDVWPLMPKNIIITPPIIASIPANNANVQYADVVWIAAVIAVFTAASWAVPLDCKPEGTRIVQDTFISFDPLSSPYFAVYPQKIISCPPPGCPCQTTVRRDLCFCKPQVGPGAPPARHDRCRDSRAAQCDCSPAWLRRPIRSGREPQGEADNC